MSNLTTRLQKLNPAQRHAVDTTEGPVMVIAGPGTGKTETLGARIANILEKQTDIHAGNILCLTYTNAGVVAMRKRLQEFIGPSAHKVQIHTFHSFCNMIIQENADYFGIKSAENISQLEQYECVEKIIDGLPADHPLFHKNSYHDAKNLLSLFGTMKGESWTVEIIEDAVQNFLQDLPNREDMQYKRKYTNKKTGDVFEKGDANPKKLENETQKKEKFLAAAKLFPQYQEYLKTKGLYDFNDMIVWILEAFASDENFLAKYQEQFQYILVDEFQDTNGSQKKLIDYLCSYWDEPNIFVVGDDDQSIYRFQGANMKNILEFYTQHEQKISIITLDKNYRSSQNILDIADHIIEKNTERLVAQIPNATKTLTAENPKFADITIKPNLRGYYNALHEELGIIKRLKALQTKGENLSDVAVIYQNHAQVSNILKICEQEKIPVRIKETQNVLDLPIIQQVIALVQYFSDELEKPFSGEEILFKSLFYPFFGIAKSDITMLALRRRNAENEEERFFKSLISICANSPSIPLNEGEASSPFGVGVVPPSFRGARGEQFKNPNPLQNFAQIFDQLQEDFVSLPLVRFVEKIFTRCQVVTWVMQQEEKAFLLRALSTFFQFIKDEAASNENFCVADMQEKISRMNTHGITLPIQKILYEKQGVNFITAHSSKGLEFDYVFLIGVDKRVWDRERAPAFSFPDTLTFSNSGDFLEEKRRLFFVALTRAKQFVEVSYAQKDLNGKELDTSIFIAEYLEKISSEGVEYPEDEVLEYQSKLMMNFEPDTLDFLQPEFLRPLLEDYRMSPTHLNKYLKCPLSFYFENLLRIPSAMPPAAAFGTAIHWVLEKIFIEGKQTGKFSQENILKNFSTAMQKHKFLCTQREYEKFLRYGEKILPQYFDKYLAKKSGTELSRSVEVGNYHVEKSIQTNIGEVPVSGKMDRVDTTQGGVIPQVDITDYKTGNASSPFTTEKCWSPCEKNNFEGGDYWRQIVFYALLAENNPTAPWAMQKGIIDFVEPDKAGNFSQKIFTVSAEDKNLVQDQIQTSYKKIMNMEFYGCGEEDCRWCGK